MKTRYVNLSFYFQLNEQSNNHDVYKYHISFKYFFHLLPKMKLSSENGHNFLKSFTLTLPKSLKLNMKHILKVLDLNHIYPQQTQQTLQISMILIFKKLKENSVWTMWETLKGYNDKLAKQHTQNIHTNTQLIKKYCQKG